MKTLAILLSVFAGAVLTACAFLWIAAGEIYDYDDTFEFASDAAKTDVVLCLAGGKGRIPMAVDLWMKIRPYRARAGKPEPVLFFSGVGVQAANLDTLREQGISKDVLALFTKENVIFENVSENTFENAQLFSSFARQKQWKQVLLVTAGYHMRRSQFILEQALDSGIEIRTHTVDSVQFDRNLWHQDPYAVRVTLIEYIKWLFYRYSYG